MRLKHVGKIAGFVPVMVTTEDVVRCAECSYESRATIAPEEFLQIDPERVKEYIVPKITVVAKFCVIGAIVFCCVPPATLPMSIAGLLMVKGKSSGWTTLAIIAVVLTTIFAIMFVIVMIQPGNE